MRQRKLKDLQSKSFQGDFEEWETILKHVFGVENSPSPAIQDLQVVAEINGDDPTQTVTIILRKRIQQISQRLGSIELHQNDDEEVQLFDWTAQAVQDAQSQTGEVERLKYNLDSAKSTIRTLESKLDELVKLKSEQDGQMLAQFAALLNEKKLKIRNQQRVLSSAKIDRKTLRGLGRAAAEAEGEQSKHVTNHKRKATTAPVESSDDDAFDTMDVDEGSEEGGLRSRDDFQADTESDRASTPEQETEEEEQSEPEDPEPKHDKPRSVSAKRSNQRSKQSSKKDGGPATTKDHHTRQAAKDQKKTTPSPPPRRDLPFNRRADAKGKEPEPPKPQADDEDEETATEDDDEL